MKISFIFSYEWNQVEIKQSFQKSLNNINIYSPIRERST